MDAKQKGAIGVGKSTERNSCEAAKEGATDDDLCNAIEGGAIGDDICVAAQEEKLTAVGIDSIEGVKVRSDGEDVERTWVDAWVVDVDPCNFLTMFNSLVSDSSDMLRAKLMPLPSTGVEYDVLSILPFDDALSDELCTFFRSRIFEQELL